MSTFRRRLMMLAAQRYVKFEDPEIERICIEKWGRESRVTKEELAAVEDIGSTFSKNKKIRTFKEFRYFDGIFATQQQAFSFCPNLREVWIPENIKNIYSWFSLGSEQLKTVVVLCKNPPKIHSSFMYIDTAYNYPSNLNIYVPDDTLGIYKEKWGNFNGNHNIYLASFLRPFSQYKGK